MFNPIVFILFFNDRTWQRDTIVSSNCDDFSVINIAIIPSAGSSKNFNNEFAEETFNFSALLIIYTFLFPKTDFFEKIFFYLFGEITD